MVVTSLLEGPRRRSLDNVLATGPDNLSVPPPLSNHLASLMTYFAEYNPDATVSARSAQRRDSSSRAGCDHEGKAASMSTDPQQAGASAAVTVTLVPSADLDSTHIPVPVTAVASGAPAAVVVSHRLSQGGAYASVLSNLYSPLAMGPDHDHDCESGADSGLVPSIHADSSLHDLVKVYYGTARRSYSSALARWKNLEKSIHFFSIIV